MSFEIWWLYVATVLVFMITPGPSHLLMLSNSVSNGFNRSLATAAGDLSANFLQMLAASLGLATVLQSSQQTFIYIKWAGVCYLVYLGVTLLVSKKPAFESGSVRSSASLYWQGFITSAANPKAVIFFAALFPQFIVPDQNLLPQFLMLSISYLIIDGTFLCMYGKFADVLARKLFSRVGQYMNGVSGVLLLMAAAALGLKDVERS